MVFSGDSIEYLEMANQLSNGRFPKSQMWMPLYPLMIWIFSKIFFVDLLLGAKLYHFILSSFFVMSYNKFFVQNQSNNTLNRFILNTPIFAFLIFLEQSITIMAEFQFLVITLMFFYWINKILKEKKSNDVFIATSLVILSIATKYNGFVNFAVLIIVLFYVFPLKRMLILSLISSVSVAISYGSWLLYKPGGDFLIGAVKVVKVDYCKIYILITKDFFLSISKYFLPFQLNESVKLYVPELIMTFIITVFFLMSSIYVLFSFIKRRMTLNKFLILFVVIYSGLFILRSLPLGKNETNTRTIFYILFIGTYLFSSYAISTKSLTKKILLLIIPLLGITKVVKSIPTMYFEGIGPLANKEYNGNSVGIRTIMAIKDSLNIEAREIYSNEHKILSLFCDYQKVSELPKSKEFGGNAYFENLQVFDIESKKLLETIENTNKWLLVYVQLGQDHPRYDAVLDSFITIKLNNNGFHLNMKKTSSTIIIWPK